MQNELMQQGVELMLYGMGTVFTFLALLIVATTFMSIVVRRFVKPELLPAKVVHRQPVEENDEQLVAIIGAAIHKYRSRNK
jgi:oxaloacetate decarboxylase gamma subunit|tara:strand:- start:402 stop:644 length:243 start_codon:yes stop_codon:yes gene_type:complete